MKKGISLISGVLFLAITITATVLVYELGMPIIKQMQAASTIDQMKAVFAELDQQIQQVASEGKGSKRTYYLRLDAGEFSVNSSKNTIEWEYEIDVEVISPRTAQWIGNTIIGSNLETKAYESTHDGTPCYVLENEHLKVYINRTGSASSHAQLSTSDLLIGIWQKDLSALLGLDSLNITLDNKASSQAGSAYTGIERLGDDLPYATVFAYMNTSYDQYFINFTLESGADFLIIEGSLA